MGYLRCTKIALIGIASYVALSASNLLAQKVDIHGYLIEDTKVAGCVNHLGSAMAQAGLKVPFTIKMEISSETAAGRQANIISDPAIADCVNRLAQDLVRTRRAQVPFVIEFTAAPPDPFRQ